MKLFRSNQNRYGYRKVWYTLRACGWKVSQRLVLKLMQNLR
ncbi:IS3 family transposase [Rothia dentocariosa]